MNISTQNGVSFYRFANLAACGGVDHRIFTRNCGCSQPPFGSMNVSFGIGDRQKNVLAVENPAVISAA